MHQKQTFMVAQPLGPVYNNLIVFDPHNYPQIIGFQTLLTNRHVKLPYIDLAVYIISASKQIGVEAEHKLEESATWSQSRVTRDFDLLLDPYGSTTVGDPDERMVKFTTGGRITGAASANLWPTRPSRSMPRR